MKQVYFESGGVKRTFITDSDRPNSLTVHTELQMDGILDGIARDRELMKNTGDNKVIARVPMTIYERSIHEEWDDDDWKKWLNSSEAVSFRIWQGTV